MPVKDPAEFEKWVNKQWLEKEALLEYFEKNGRFPADNAALGSKSESTQDTGFIETQVKLSHWAELGQIFAVLGALALVANVLVKLWTMFFTKKEPFIGYDYL